ncbi:MAG TPA: isoprenyl transferase [Spongiibacteraceae bacterium]|nr:isoprenyl transferase [Spongiibacteraceae bacterium]
MTDSPSAETPFSSEALARVPRHVAIIMDGNNRWAKRRGLPGAAGHRAGVEAIRAVLRAGRKNGVEVITLFAFSSENWTRPSAEVAALMQLFSLYLNNEVKKLHEDNVRLHFIGRRDRLNAGLQKKIAEAEKLTAANTASHLVIAVDYGGQWDIVNAARELAQEVAEGKLHPDQIDESLFDRHTALSNLPKPDLLIRTAGEQRISNFLLWQCAYSEFYFTDVFWPDFDEIEMQRALRAYGQRERRFGGREDAANSVAEA